MNLTPETQNLLLLALWTLLCLCLGFSMGRKTIVQAELKERTTAPSKDPFSFEDEPGFVEDEILKKQESGYRRIGQGKVERKLEDE